MSYVDYGPYAVFGPQIDGRDASCNADESDLLALTYADLVPSDKTDALKLNWRGGIRRELRMP